MSIKSALAARHSFLTQLKQAKADMLSENIQEIVIEEPMELILELVNQVAQQVSIANSSTGAQQIQEAINVDGLVSQFRDDNISNYFVMLLRLITSS